MANYRIETGIQIRGLSGQTNVLQVIGDSLIEGNINVSGNLNLTSTASTININSSNTNLNISGKTITNTLQVTNGPSPGYVLTSDVDGNATWQAPTGGGGVTGTTVSVTGFTYSNNNLTIRQSNGTNYTVNVSTMTGLTVNGTLSATTVNKLKIGTGKGNTNPPQPFQNNIAIGNLVLNSNTTGYGNFGIGDESLFNNTIGSDNIAIGYYSLISNVSGNNNVMVGQNAGGTIGFGVSNIANYNVGFGNGVLGFNYSGSSNNAFGYNSLFYYTGPGNTAIGHESGFGVDVGGGPIGVQDNGSYNTFIGYKTDNTVGGLTNATAIGANAKVSSSNSLILGNNANVGIGVSAPSTKLEVSGKTKTTDLQVTNGPSPGYVLTSDGVGNATWQAPTGGGTFTGGTVEGFSNFINGLSATTIITEKINDLPLKSVKSNSTNFIGTNIAPNLSTNPYQGLNNLAFGNFALNSLISASRNIAIGNNSLSNIKTNPLNNNIAIGQNNLQNLTGGTGGNNVSVGTESFMLLNEGSNNTSIGHNNANNITNVNNTTLIGYLANVTVNGLTNATAIGANAKVSASNSMVLGDNVNVGIGVSAPSTKLEVSGKTKTTDLQVTNGAAVGYLLSSSDVNGNSSWQAPPLSLTELGFTVAQPTVINQNVVLPANSGTITYTPPIGATGLTMGVGYTLTVLNGTTLVVP